MLTWLTRAAIAVAAGVTFAAVWIRLPGLGANELVLYPFVLFPYALFALMTRDRGAHLALLLGGTLFLIGLWLWVLVREPGPGGPSVFAATVTHLVTATVVGIIVMLLGRRARQSPPQTPL
jgi:hypothetical protein